MINKILWRIVRLFPMSKAYAHCDIPCGIYTADAALVAANTVLKMVEKITNLPARDEKNIESVRNFHNAMTRYVMAKEEHAQKCKTELLILWTDFFKEEHLAMFPQLHETFWKAAKLCSKNKQQVSAEEARALVQAVQEIADMFRKAHDTSHR